MKKQLLRIVTLIFLVLSINTAPAQPLQGQAKIDSLLKEFPKMKKDTNAVNLLSQLSFDMYASNPDKGIKYGEQGLKLAENIGWKLGKANCLRSLGVVYSTQSNYPKALEYYSKALKINEELGNKSGVASNLGNMGLVYNHQSDYPKALEYYSKALKINEELGNKSGVANNLNNIGIIYAQQSDYTKALEYYLKALKINEELGNKSWIANNLNNIGIIYNYQSDYPKALAYYSKSLKINEELGNKSWIANNLNNIGIIYNYQSDYPKALAYYSKSLKINEELGNKSGVASNLGNMGSTYFALSQDSVSINPSELNQYVSLNKDINLNRSIEYSLQAIKIFEEIGELDKRSYYLKTLANAYKKKGEMMKAYNALEEHHKLKDSVFSEEKNKQISALEKAREDDLNRLKIEKQEILLKAQEDEKQLIILSAIGALISILIILFVIINQRSKSEKLLLNVLPAKIAKRLKAKEHPIADHFDSASIMFIDIVGFTKMSSETDPKRIVAVLNDIFTIFDKLAEKHGLEKIKTIGDAYMAAAGIPEKQVDHAKRTAEMALNIKSEMKEFRTSDGTEIKFRIGIECGSVVAGVIGEKKFIYDLWSDAVNIANRMESTGESGKIHISENFKNELEKFEGNWQCTFRGEQNIKGKGIMNTYFLEN